MPMTIRDSYGYCWSDKQKLDYHVNNVRMKSVGNVRKRGNRPEFENLNELLTSDVSLVSSLFLRLTTK